LKNSVLVAGTFLASEASFPLLISVAGRYLTLKPKLSRGMASETYSWCISPDLHSEIVPRGPKVTVIAGLMKPVSTQSIGAVLIPKILYTS
jgi:hypothetical protein